MAGPATKTVRFTFDRSFDAPPEPVTVTTPEPPPETFSREELDAAEAAGWQAGHAAGLEEARASLEASVAGSLGHLGMALADLMARHTKELLRIRANATELASEVGQKLARALIAAAPLGEIEHLLAECLSDLGDEPRLVVRLPDPLVDALRERIDGLASAAGFAGQIALLGDASLHGSDARIEWAHGGAERNTQMLQAAVDEAVARYISSQHLD